MIQPPIQNKVDSMKSLENKIEYNFKDSSLLRTALTHSSYANESKGRYKSNERLEFLGDSVLSLVVSQRLYSEDADRPEGELTRRRAGVVCEDSLYKMAQELQLGDHLLLGKGELSGGGNRRPSILADAFEALLGAMFLDGGLAPIESLLKKHLRMDDQFEDYKTRLQEYIQKHYDSPPVYEIVGEQGPDHDKLFETNVSLTGELLGTGSARSKKAAQQQAAKQALIKFGIKV